VRESCAVAAPPQSAVASPIVSPNASACRGT
jgi:hypothetical protein